MPWKIFFLKEYLQNIFFPSYNLVKIWSIMSKRTSFDWVVKCLVMITHPLILKLKNCSCWETKTKIWMYNLSSFSLYPLFILNNLFCLFIFLWFFTFFIFLSILMVIISLELTRVNPDRNIFSINVELTSSFFAPSPSSNF